MTRYARIVAGCVVTAFDTNRPASDFPDLDLVVVAADVRDNDFVNANGQKIEPPAAPRPPITALEFRDRFTADEKTAIYTAASASTNAGRQLRIWLDDASAAKEVHLDHPRIVAGIDYLVGAGILATGRKTEILA